MKRVLSSAVVVGLLTVAVIAGNAHFVGNPQISINGNLLTVSGKVAGLGNVPQIHVELSADAACVNRGGQNPNAENKDTFAAGGDFPVQNGKALFALPLEATFQPDCAPPMRVVWSNVALVVTAADGTLLLFP
jgi:hypothetical protein